MFRQTKQRRLHKQFDDHENVDVGAEYATRLNFYAYPPNKEVTLEEFESWAIDRLYGNHNLLMDMMMAAEIYQFLERSNRQCFETNHKKKLSKTCGRSLTNICRCPQTRLG